MTAAIISADHPALKNYYETLSGLEKLNKKHEQATRIAFSGLLETVSKPIGWTLVLEDMLANRKRPDGALLDKYGLPRGHWKAKAPEDDLEAEIDDLNAKIAAKSGP